MKIALMHYTYAPLTGGVENIMEQHAALFAGQGHETVVICSEGASDNPAVQVALIPEMQRDHLLVKAAQPELDAGEPGANFAELKSRLVHTLGPLLEKMDVVFLHNVLTMPFHLALTAALWELTEKLPHVRFIAWTHDLVACNPDYTLPHIGHFPWNLLTKRAPRVEYVAISPLRRAQFASLTGVPPESCAMIPNGIDPVDYLGLTGPVAKLVRDRAILEKEIVLLHPTRILRRKNIELGLRVVAEIKARGKSCCCIVTGAPDMHNPDTVAYHRSLIELREELGLADEFLFLHERFAVTKQDLIGLYRVADVLFYPSKQEGFGLPMLEGALHGIPVFCADVEPMKSLAQKNVTFFDLQVAPAALAGSIIAHVEGSVSIQAGKGLMRDYSWNTLYPRFFEPLLKSDPRHLL